MQVIWRWRSGIDKNMRRMDDAAKGYIENKSSKRPREREIFKKKEKNLSL